MRALLVGLSVAVAMTLVATPASAHGAGAGTIYANGTIALTPDGTLNFSFHAYLSSLGLPIGPGDTLKFAWSSNAGRGPSVYFEIHSHPASTGYIRFYNITAKQDNDTWAVPGSDAYMVYWENDNSVRVNVTYAFGLVPPPIDFLPFAVLAIAVGAAVILLWKLSGRGDDSAKKDRKRPKA